MIRHAEKPGTYNGQDYWGVDPTGNACGADGHNHLVTLGWERTGGLVSLFTAPWKPQILSTPDFLYAANPTREDPSHRPYETLTALASKLRLDINKSYSSDPYETMVGDALKTPGVVLICWQHEDIPLERIKEPEPPRPGISTWILKKTGTHSTKGVPRTWPKTPTGKDRYDLVFVFSRRTGKGPIDTFTVLPQFLLAGDLAWPQDSPLWAWVNCAHA